MQQKRAKAGKKSLQPQAFIFAHMLVLKLYVVYEGDCCHYRQPTNTHRFKQEGC